MARRRRGGKRWSYENEPQWGGDYYGFRTYVSVAERRSQAERKLRALRKSGRAVSPVQIEGRKIATTFWGMAWCDNLERYGDYANRLPRGRTYVRNGSVIDLQIAEGQVDALVSGSEIYKVRVKVSPVGSPRWKAICAQCAGGIDSLVELLQGRFSDAVMAHLCKQGTGLFPIPKEIQFTCTCPDWASMCKHVAAVLYGVGARLDARPELLFRLRKVDEHDLVARAGTGLRLSKKTPATSKRLADEDLGGVFGLDLASLPDEEPPPPIGNRTARREAPRKATPAPLKPVAPPKPRRRLDPATRKAVSEPMKAYWQKRRQTKRDDQD